MRRNVLLFVIAGVLVIGALAGAWRAMIRGSDNVPVAGSPNVFVTPSSPASRVSTTTLAVVGDIMLSRSVGKQMVLRDDFSYPFSGALGFLKGADAAFGNLEGPMSDKGKNQGSVYSFRADPRAVQGLKAARFSVLSLANNHMLDWGRPALEDTVRILLENGIESVGAGSDFAEANKPVIIERNGTKIAFLAYTNLLPRSFAADSGAGVSTFDQNAAVRDIALLKSSDRADIVVVSFHWGEEYQKHANAFQKITAHALVDAGADIILGHHPHVAQEAESYRGKFIFYSLGNFVFDQNFSAETMHGRAALITLAGNALISAQLYQNTIDETFRVASMKEDGVLYSNSTTTIP